MPHQIEIHKAQIAILRELLFKPNAKYSELQKSAGLDSDHFKFHIKKLAEIGYVEKTKGGAYQLTTSGKEHANKLDTDAHTVERQPKIAVLLFVDSPTKEGEVIFQQRIKQPFYGYWGLPSGKVRWGETIYQTAERELMEETGLTANISFKNVYHVHTVSSDGLLEDKVFFLMHCTEAKGKLLVDFEGGRNESLSPKELLAKDKVFSDVEYTLDLATSRTIPDLNEKTVEIQPEEF